MQIEVDAWFRVCPVFWGQRFKAGTGGYLEFKDPTQQVAKLHQWPSSIKTPMF